ncbi:MAG: phosphatidate cytidylyltransferase [Armatimonadota bacterium]|nr:phosphatidate cytidylyltransferase [Armatimonadota bacterium]MDR7532891.1 phosphatidate cytidylyltransferase [Armatimonadota bacterium]MDR7536098.1 phosphatidate cytidylyltransferase [Armatimonadota bacterium]
MTSARAWPDRALGARVATIVVGGPVFLAAVWAGGLALLAVVLALVAVALVEYRRLAQTAGLRPAGVVLGGGVGFPLLAAWGLWPHAGALVAALVAAAAGTGLWPERRAGALAHAGAAVLGAVYVGLLFAHLVLARAAFGPGPLLALLGVVWASDIAAYLVGVRWGRRRLLPAVSPGKSVEGVAAGLAAGAAVAAAAGGVIGWPAAQSALGGVLVAAIGVVGDLWESALKRAAGAKDSGAWLPGHGGILDRFDAVLFGVPAGYYLMGWLR